METFTNGAHPATFVCILMEWLLNSIVKKVSLFCSSSSKCVLTLGVGHVENSKKKRRKSCKYGYDPSSGLVCLRGIYDLGTQQLWKLDEHSMKKTMFFHAITSMDKGFPA